MHPLVKLAKDTIESYVRDGTSPRPNELTPEMAALRDSVLAEARVKLEAVRKARSAYGSGRARVRYAPPPHLLEATRRLAGAEFEPLGPELSHDGLEQGLLVLRVIEGTPAHRLGLRRIGHWRAATTR